MLIGLRNIYCALENCLNLKNSDLFRRRSTKGAEYIINVYWNYQTFDNPKKKKPKSYSA